jgi:hypothetical protein
MRFAVNSMVLEGLHAMARPMNEDWFWFLRPLVEKAIKKYGLLDVCRQAGCVKGRKSIRDWLDGREDGESKLTLRALPEPYAIALMQFLTKLYPDDARGLRKQALDWLEVIKQGAEEREKKESEMLILDLAREYEKRKRGS